MNNETCESMKEIGNRARIARRFLRLTQQTVADHLGMKRQSYIEIEKGRRRLMATEIPILCNLIRITPNDLLGFDG
jgi:DNA-binding XRE family transcriptional regulator